MFVLEILFSPEILFAAITNLSSDGLKGYSIFAARNRQETAKLGKSTGLSSPLITRLTKYLSARLIAR